MSTVTSDATPAFATRDDGPAVERIIVRDMLRRGWPAIPVLVALGGIWGVHGVLSAAYGTALAVVNFCVAAWLLSTAARISLALLAGAAFGGYVVRLGLITIAVLLVVHQPWVSVVPLCLALLVAHLGLLAWEARFVSHQLAFPGVMPKRGAS